jgi:hypothetical protein
MNEELDKKFNELNKSLKKNIESLHFSLLVYKARVKALCFICITELAIIAFLLWR